MTIQRMDNELGMELEGKGQVEGLWADRTVGLDGVRSDIAMMRTPDGRLCYLRGPAGIIVALAEQRG